MARDIGKHSPGHPTLLVQNMPGAGNLIALSRTFDSVLIMDLGMIADRVGPVRVIEKTVG